MPTTTNDTNAQRSRGFSEEMLRASYVSLFWGVIAERRRRGVFTLQSLADALGIDKSGVSRWFSGDAPNWELNTVADIAEVLGVDLQAPTAVERSTGHVFTPAGVQDVEPTTDAQSMLPVEEVRTSTNPVPASRTDAQMRRRAGPQVSVS